MKTKTKSFDFNILAVGGESSFTIENDFPVMTVMSFLGTADVIW